MKRKIIKIIKKAFTLIELVVVIAVIAILAGVSVAAYFGITESAKDSRLKEEVKQVENVFTTWRLLEYEPKKVAFATIKDQYNNLANDYLVSFAKYSYDQGLNTYLNFALFDSEGNPLQSSVSSIESDPSLSKAIYLVSTEDRYAYFEVNFSINSDNSLNTYKYSPEFDFTSLDFTNYTIYKNIKDVNLTLFNEDNNNYWMFNLNEVPSFNEDGKLDQYNVILGDKTYKIYAGKQFSFPKAGLEFIENEDGSFIEKEFLYYYIQGEEDTQYKEFDKLIINKDLTIIAKYNEEGISNIGAKIKTGKTSYSFSSFEEAVEYIKENSGKDFTLSTQKDTPIVIKEDLTIPSNLTIILSGSDSNANLESANNTLDGTNDETPKNPDEPTYVYNSKGVYEKEEAYSTFTIEEGVTLTLEGDARIVVNGVNKEDGKITYGHLINNGTIELNGNSTLDCYGLIDGNGEINVNDQATINEKMDVNDWPGLMKVFEALTGGGITGDYSHISKVPFPFNNYLFDRIQNDVNFSDTSFYNAIAAVNLADAIETGTTIGLFSEVKIQVIGPDSEGYMFYANDNNVAEYPIVKTNDGNKTIVEINGDVKDAGANVSIGILESSLDLSSEAFQLPLTDFIININEGGALTINQKYAFMPGSGINVNGGKLIANEGSVLTFFDKDFFINREGKSYSQKDYYLNYEDATLNVISGEIEIETGLVCGTLVLPIDSIEEVASKYPGINITKIINSSQEMVFYLADITNPDETANKVIVGESKIILKGNNDVTLYPIG